jgi:hypothetical protein
VETIERQRLIAALTACGQHEATECADQLRAGFEAKIYDKYLAPAAELAKAYRRLAEHVRRIAWDSRGYDEAVVHFEAEDGAALILCAVDGVERRYAFWLTSDGSRVVACVSSPGDAFRPARHELLARLNRAYRATR